MKFKKQTLKNGLTLITVPMKDSPSVTCLVMVKTGSKYETKDINGLSHFLEHMCFKGTKKRPTALDISMELDSIGSQSNAFTSHEFTGYYAKAHPKHFNQVLDVVSDLYVDPVFDSNEIEKEKGVIVGEIDMYEDMPKNVASELFMELMYGDQPAGWKIIGTKENVRRMKKEDFVGYRKKHYVASATTVIVSGNFNEKKALADVNRLFKNILIGTKGKKIKTIEKQTTPNIKIKNKDTDQTHVVLGVRTFGSSDKREITLKVLNSILGEGMSSRLFQKLRDEMGAGYYVRSSIDDYTDHGYLAVTTGVDKKRVKEVVEAILGEFRKLINTPVSDSELRKSKDYLTGNMYLGLESSDSLGVFYAIQDILSSKIMTPDEVTIKIEKVTSKDIQKLAKEIFVNKGLNLAIVGDIKDEKEISKIFSI